MLVRINIFKSCLSSLKTILKFSLMLWCFWSPSTLCTNTFWERHKKHIFYNQTHRPEEKDLKLFGEGYSIRERILTNTNHNKCSSYNQVGAADPVKVLSCWARDSGLDSRFGTFSLLFRFGFDGRNFCLWKWIREEKSLKHLELYSLFLHTVSQYFFPLGTWSLFSRLDGSLFLM